MKQMACEGYETLYEVIESPYGYWIPCIGLKGISESTLGIFFLAPYEPVKDFENYIDLVDMVVKQYGTNYFGDGPFLVDGLFYPAARYKSADPSIQYLFCRHMQEFLAEQGINPISIKGSANAPEFCSYFIYPDKRFISPLSIGTELPTTGELSDDYLDFMASLRQTNGSSQTCTS